MNIEHRIMAAAVLAIAALTGGAAGAQDYYIKGFGGWTMPDDDDFTLNDRDTGTGASSGLEYDTGTVLGAGIGYDYSRSLSLEAEYVYRDADARLRGGANGSTESNAWMVNALYRFRPLGPGEAVHPYAGGGIGMADLTVENAGQTFGSDYEFAWQLIGGLGYDVTPNVQLFGEARYFVINEESVGNGGFDFRSGYDSFDVLFGASYRF